MPLDRAASCAAARSRDRRSNSSLARLARYGATRAAYMQRRSARTPSHSQAERRPDGGWPTRGSEPVGHEESERDALETNAPARGVRHVTLGGDTAERLAAMVLM